MLDHEVSSQETMCKKDKFFLSNQINPDTPWHASGIFIIFAVEF